MHLHLKISTFEQQVGFNLTKKTHLGAMERSNVEHKELFAIKYKTLIRFKPSWQGYLLLHMVIKIN
jgi:hypothetical protein